MKFRVIVKLSLASPKATAAAPSHLNLNYLRLKQVCCQHLPIEPVIDEYLMLKLNFPY